MARLLAFCLLAAVVACAASKETGVKSGESLSLPAPSSGRGQLVSGGASSWSSGPSSWGSGSWGSGLWGPGSFYPGSWGFGYYPATWGFGYHPGSWGYGGLYYGAYPRGRSGVFSGQLQEPQQLQQQEEQQHGL